MDQDDPAVPADSRLASPMQKKLVDVPRSPRLSSTGLKAEVMNLFIGSAGDHFATAHPECVS